MAKPPKKPPDPSAVSEVSVRSTKKRLPADRAGKHADSIDYKAYFEEAADAVLVVNHEGRYIDANKAACELTGYTRAELLRKGIGDLTVPQERTAAADRFHDLEETGRSGRVATLVRKDGSHLVVELHAVSLSNGLYMGVLRDISEKIHVQRELQNALDEYTTLVKICHAGVLSTGPDGLIRFWNPAAEALFGYTAREAIGMPVSRLLPEDRRAGLESEFTARMNSLDSKPFGKTLVTEARRKDGSTLIVEVSIGAWRQGDKRLATAVVRDMTSHRDMVERLNDAVQRLQFHVERMPLAYIVWDMDFRVSEWNKAAERIFGYTKKEALGRDAYSLIVPDDMHDTVRDVWQHIQVSDTPSHSINANVRKDGSRFIGEWFNTSLRDADGVIRGVASMAMDVSEREQLEVQLRTTQRLESLGVLAAGVAHDFNSALMVILGNAALLRSLQSLPARAKEYIDLIDDAGARAKELIRHLLAYARTGRHMPQVTDLNQIINEALPFIQSSLGVDHCIELSLGKKLPMIWADHSQIEQILLNLCLNAKQAMTAPGNVRVRTRHVKLSSRKIAACVPPDIPPGDYIELTVADHGVGMSTEALTRVFDPFFTTKVEGHGLGLAAVVGILRQHNGAVLIHSELGIGTEVSVYLPVRKN